MKKEWRIYFDNGNYVDVSQCIYDGIIRAIENNRTFLNNKDTNGEDMLFIRILAISYIKKL